jgi:hypothetical protein
MTDITEHPARASAEAVEDLLDAWMDGLADDIGGVPADTGQADGLLWVLRHVRQRIMEAEEVAAERIADITGWLEAVATPLANRASYLETMLEQWAQAEHERTGRKTWKLPAGELRVRPRLVRSDTVTAPSAMDEGVIDTIADLVPMAVEYEVKVKPGEVKKLAHAGAVVHGLPVPDGYEARQAVITMLVPPPPDGPEDPPSGDPDPAVGAGRQDLVVPGIVLYVPLPGREGRVFAAVTR